jgi:hypothetical protein
MVLKTVNEGCYGRGAMGCKTAGNAAGHPGGMIDREEAMTRFAIVALLAFSAVFLLGPAARAQVTRCSGSLSGPTVYQHVSVPDGATCLLQDVTVVGNVSVGTDATLLLAANTNIGGNLRADRCSSMGEIGPANVTPPPIIIGGNVEIHDCTIGASLGPLTGESFPGFIVRGNLSCENNGDYCILNGAEIAGNVRLIENVQSQIYESTIGGNVAANQNSCTKAGCEAASVVKSTIAGNVVVNENSGPANATSVGGNEIGGNLQCRGNSAGVTNDEDGPNMVGGKKEGQCAGL